METHPEFPQLRRQDLRRGTEVVVHDQPTGSWLPGHALCHLKPMAETPELDFAVGTEGVARVGIQVKGGRYSVDRAA